MYNIIKLCFTIIFCYFNIVKVITNNNRIKFLILQNSFFLLSLLSRIFLTIDFFKFLLYIYKIFIFSMFKNTSTVIERGCRGEKYIYVMYIVDIETV